MTRYPVILADPPVPFETWGKRPGGIDSRAAAAHYDVMTWDGLGALGPLIADVAAPDACLFLWMCQPLLIETLRMAEAWGWAYKTKAFSWVKLRPSGGLTFHVGMGYWTRANTEDVLLFTRGSPQRVRKDVYQMIASLEAAPHETPAVLAPVARHSAKPAEIHDRIERLVAGPYLELFGRRPRAGWTVLGNEIDGLDIREALRREAALAAVEEVLP
jgi:N6-adenosine-specific RNA methylase IME4